MENLEKSWNFKLVISRPGKVMEKNLNHKSFEKVMEICYHVFIYAEFDIINMFFKERRSKYKPAIALDTQDSLNCSCLYRDFSLVMEIWFKVREKSWKCMIKMCKNPELNPTKLNRRHKYFTHIYCTDLCSNSASK